MNEYIKGYDKGYKKAIEDVLNILEHYKIEFKEVIKHDLL